MEVVLHLPVVPNVELVAAKAVETLGGALGMPQTRVEASCVAIVEACLNAMEHGGGEVVVRLSGENESGRPRLVIEVEDHRWWVRPGQGAAQDRRAGPGMCLEEGLGADPDPRAHG